MIWSTVQYDWPAAILFALLALPLAWGFVFLCHYRKRKLEAFADASVLDVVMQERWPAAFWIKTFLFCLAWVCGVAALAQPKGNERYVVPSGKEIAKPLLEKAALRKKMHEVIFLLDVSASMEVADIHGAKTREAVAKEIADDVIRRLKGESVSLFAFTSATMQIVPSTMDYLFTRLMLRQVGINEGETEGTNIEQALEAVRKRYFDAPSAKTKTLVVLSDGGDTRLMGLQGQQRKETIDAIVKPIADAEEKNLRVLVVGLGSKEGKEIPGISYQGRPVLSAVEEPLLRKLSLIGQGELFLVDESTSMQVSQAIGRSIARDAAFVEVSPEELAQEGGSSPIYDLYFQVPLGIALLALLCCFLIPDTQRQISMEPN